MTQSGKKARYGLNLSLSMGLCFAITHVGASWRLSSPTSSSWTSGGSILGIFRSITGPVQGNCSIGFILKLVLLVLAVLSDPTDDVSAATLERFQMVWIANSIGVILACSPNRVSLSRWFNNLSTSSGSVILGSSAIESR